MTRSIILFSLVALVSQPARAQDSFYISSPNPEEWGRFGFSVSAVPDVDGDGTVDLVIGAPQEAGDIYRSGRAYVFSGSTGELIHTLVSPNPESNGAFGYTVFGVPDSDGEGVGNIIVGAPIERDGGTLSGRVYVFSGSTGDLLHTLTSPNPGSASGFGRSISAGSEGTSILIGAPNEDEGEMRPGRAYVFDRVTGALIYSLSSPSPRELGRFGDSVAVLPDIDGDGYEDFAVGGGSEDSGSESLSGRVHIFSGATGELLQSLTSPNAQYAGFFGNAVVGVSDLDGDGRGDILIGADYETGGAARSGRAYVFSGATGALLHTLVSPTPIPGESFGTRVASVPDVDGDGIDDLVIGSAIQPGAGRVPGAAYVFSGATGQLIRTLTSPNPEEMGFFGGRGIAGLPDLNGDGRGEIVVGAYQEEAGAPRSGRVYVFSEGTSTSSGPVVSSLDLSLTSYPNPVSGTATLALVVPSFGAVRVEVYDILGRRVEVLHDGEVTAGQHSFAFEASRLAQGLYVVRASFPDGLSASWRLIVMR